jgi:putative transposase
MRLLAYCILPNHWHLVLWPRGDGELSEYMQWLTVTHTQRYHAAHETSGTGPLYQGRFKSFPVQEDDHFYRVCRYVERNAFRASLVSRVELWRWSSLWQSLNLGAAVSLDAWPLPRPVDWLDIVARPETEGELAALRAAVTRGRPYGDNRWRRTTAKALGLESTLRARGRPRTTPE